MKLKYTPFLLFILLFKIMNGQVIYNAYARVTAVTSSTLLTVNNVNETNHTYTVGGQVIVMQMQDDVIGTNTTNAVTFGNLSGIANAGRFEVRTISAVNRSAGTATSIALSAALLNTYNTGANSRVQVISFRLLNATVFTSTASITGLAWNGNVGGVIALEVGTDFTLSHSITANGIGFRGGAVSSNYYGGGTTCSTIDYATSSTQCAFKGEGIYAVTSATQANGIAKVLNGGGGGGQDINGGGGGGGNFSAGGNGGGGWNGGSGCALPGGGGNPGISLSASIGPSRVYLGGGGGGGQQNNSAATAGGNGGGIILLKANRLITGGCAFSPTITANANSAVNCGNDGGGGGGAGGSIVMNVANYSISAGCPLTVRANGGNGGTVNTSTHAGGGAGGQGVVIYSIVQPTANVTTQTNNGTAGCNDSGCASSAGPAAGSNNAGIVASSIGVLPVDLLYFVAELSEDKVNFNWASASEKNTSHYLVKRSTDGLNWSAVDRVNAYGTTQIKQLYTGVDYNPPSGILYYRLTSVDFDLSEKNFPPKALERTKAEATLVLFPNPATSLLTIAWSENTPDVKIELFDRFGRTINQTISEILDSKRILDVSSLASGIYIVKCTLNNKIHVAKLIIE
jgi:hypothetical protein